MLLPIYIHMLLENAYKKILLEGSRDNALLPVMQRYGIEMSLSQFKQAMLRKLTSGGLRSLSLGGNFYLLGAIMYYLNGDLTENTPAIFEPNRSDNPDDWKDTFKRDVCIRLNVLISILRNHHVDTLGAEMEQPEDFGNLPLNKLLKKYNSKINKALGITKDSKNTFLTDTTAGQNYTYEVITSYEQCKKYNGYTDWCITWRDTDAHYNGYTKEARNPARKPAHFIIFRQNGFESIPEKAEPEMWLPGPEGLPKPQDTFGNSLIALLQLDDSPKPTIITSRWNHGSKIGEKLEADQAYTTEEFLKTIGCDKSILEKVYKEWVAQAGSEANTSSRMEKTNIIRRYKYAQMSINNGNTVENIFKDKVYVLGTGKKGRTATALVYLPISENGGYGYITLYDRGKLFYDDYLVKVSKWVDPKNYKSYIRNDDDYRENGFTYNVPLMLRNDKFEVSMYNPMLKKFLNIGGIRFFPKYDYWFCCGWYFRNNRRFVAVGMTINKVAIVDMQKCEPAVVADNGNPWFERIQKIGVSEEKRNRRKQYTYLPDIQQNSMKHQYILTYDSASDEKYIFDSASGLYTNIDNLSNIGDEIENPGEGVTGKFKIEDQKVYTSEKVPGCVLLVRQYVEQWSTGPYETTQYAFYDLSTNDLLEICGYKVFDYVKCEGTIVGIIPSPRIYGDEVRRTAFFYDISTGKDLTLNGELVKMKCWVAQLDTVGSTKTPISYISIGDSEYTNFLIYNPLKHEFLEHNGSHLFRIENRSNGIIRAQDETEIQLTSPEEDAQRQQQTMESIRRSFNMLLEQMNRYNKTKLY